MNTFEKVLIVVSTNRGVSNQTRVCIEALRAKGAQYIEQQGCSDVALARNIALSQAVQELKGIETVLMIDDDVIFTVGDAEKIITSSQGKKLPTGGCVVTAHGKFSGKPLTKNKWLTGLSFLAVPANMLLELASRSKVVQLNDTSCYIFTWCGVEDKSWMGEDYRLLQRLGGAQILPVRIGHLKLIPMWPAEEGQEKEMQEWLNKQLQNA